MTVQVTAIHAAFADANQSITVEAGAGCGKTTLIVTGERYLPRDTLFLAFNKAIADELTRRMPHRTCKTFHAIALSNLTSRIGRVKVDSYKYQTLAQEAGASREEAKSVSEVVDRFQTQVDGCFVEAKQWTPDYIKSVIPEADLYEIDIPENSSLDFLLGIASQVLILQAKGLKSLSFSDMLFFLVHFSIHKKWKLNDWDCVVVDEAQDVSPIRLEIIKRLADRCIQVGDPRQAIYAFAGAMNGAMNNIADAFGCKSYPLSTTWRCSLNVVQEATNIIGPFLEARPNAPEGRVDSIAEGFLYQSYLDENSMVICRTNAPLVSVAMRLLRQGVPFNFMSDMPEKMAKRAEKLGKGLGGMAAFKTAVRDYFEQKLLDVKSSGLRARIEDEMDCLLTMSEYCSQPEEVPSRLRQLAYSSKGVLLTTGHKAKGLEAQNVYILRPDLIPAPWVSQEDNPEAYQQEVNLHYVMATRAKENLFYLQPESK